MVSSHPDVEALTRVLPAASGVDEAIDWDAVEAEWGTRLPSDYQAFMATYGCGAVWDLGILRPLLYKGRPTQWFSTIADETPTIRHLWDESGAALGTGLGADAVLPWGGGCNGCLMGWLMNSPDPDQWPVVVWARHGSPHWTLHACGMAAFLRRLMLAEFDANPLSDDTLWGNVEPFVHWREAQRRYFAGLDTLTGEPDPYADMYPADPREFVA